MSASEMMTLPNYLEVQIGNRKNDNTSILDTFDYNDIVGSNFFKAVHP